MLETGVRSLGREDPLEKEMATQSSILGESHGQRGLAGYSLWGHKNWTRLWWTHHHGVSHAPLSSPRPPCVHRSALHVRVHPYSCWSSPDDRHSLQSRPAPAPIPGSGGTSSSPLWAPGSGPKVQEGDCPRGAPAPPALAFPPAPPPPLKTTDRPAKPWGQDDGAGRCLQLGQVHKGDNEH